jgi:hypothetical protein
VKQAEYLNLMLGVKYQLESDDINLIIAIAAILRDRNIKVSFASAPLFDELNGDEFRSERALIYKMVTQGFHFWEVTQMLGGMGSAWHAIQYLREVMNSNGGTPSLRKVAMVFVSEWPVPMPPPVSESDMAQPERQITPVEGYKGWLVTGKMELEDADHTKRTFDLNTQPEGEEAAQEPAVVQIARMLRVTWNADKGVVEPERLEKIAMLLGHMLLSEREHFMGKLKEAQSAAKPEAPLIWPKNKDHWIFDPRLSALNAPMPLNNDFPARQRLTEVAREAARFAVSRASGMGTSRVFNIEGFVENVAIGLFGDGTNEHNFDFRTLVFDKEVAAEAPKPAEPAPAPAPVETEAPAEVGK